MRIKKLLRFFLLCCCVLLVYVIATNGPLAGTPRVVIFMNASPHTGFAPLPEVVLDGRTWRLEARSSYLCPIDLELTDIDGYTYAYTPDRAPVREGESSCLPRRTPYAFWSNETYPEAVVAYMGPADPKHPDAVVQLRGEWGIFVPVESLDHEPQ